MSVYVEMSLKLSGIHTICCTGLERILRIFEELNLLCVEECNRFLHVHFVHFQVYMHSCFYSVEHAQTMFFSVLIIHKGFSFKV
jgi:hypothetical protein